MTSRSEETFRSKDTFMSNESSHKVCQEIHRRIKARGHGALKTTEKQLGLCRGYLTAMKTAGDTRLSTFFECCSVLGEPPEEVIHQALYEKVVDLKPYGRPPKICSLVSGAKGPGLSTELLEELHIARFRSPEKVLRLLYSQGDQLSPDQAGEILNLASRCFRSLCRYNDSVWCLTKGLELAPEKSSAAGYLHLGIFNLLQTFGFLSSGMHSVKKAMDGFIFSHDLNGIGTCIAYQAYYALMTKKVEEAIETYHLALNYAESMRTSALIACHQGLAACYLQLDGRESAAVHLKVASHLAKENENQESLGKILWLSASLETGERRVSRLQEAISALPDHCALDVSLATLDLVAADPQNAGLHARKVFRVLDHLSYIPVAQKALDSLLRDVFFEEPSQSIYAQARKVLTDEWARFSHAQRDRLASHRE